MAKRPLEWLRRGKRYGRGNEIVDKGAECYFRYLNGDETGFDELIGLYRENLIFFLLRFLPTVEDAEDAAEDAFVELLLHRYRENRGASLKTYLFTVGRNKALNQLKKRKRRAELSALEPGLGTEAAALEERLCRDEEQRHLLTAIDGLPPDYREALHLLYLEELSLDEAARVMKKNKKQLENLSYRAKKALREKLGKEELFHENQR